MFKIIIYKTSIRITGESDATVNKLDDKDYRLFISPHTAAPWQTKMKIHP